MKFTFTFLLAILTIIFGVTLVATEHIVPLILTIICDFLLLIFAITEK